jgi:YesN/AraC family two-component response regulator
MLSEFRLLVVEDDEEVLESICFALRDSVEFIFTARNGQEALDVYAKEAGNFTCIMTDIKMPIMNGLDFIEKVREKDQNVPFLVVSAFGDEKYMTRSLALHTFEFIYKPYDIWEIQECLETIHGNSCEMKNKRVSGF